MSSYNAKFRVLIYTEHYYLYCTEHFTVYCIVQFTVQKR